MQFLYKNLQCSLCKKHATPGDCLHHNPSGMQKTWHVHDDSYLKYDNMVNSVQSLYSIIKHTGYHAVSIQCIVQISSSIVIRITFADVHPAIRKEASSVVDANTIWVSNACVVTTLHCIILSPDTIALGGV